MKDLISVALGYIIESIKKSRLESDIPEEDILLQYVKEVQKLKEEGYPYKARLKYIKSKGFLKSTAEKIVALAEEHRFQ